jgi:hypothetical protein
MKTDNELIAEFHHESTGWTVANGLKALSVTVGPNIHGGTDGVLIYNFQYDKDWNLLMPVVEKIYQIKSSNNQTGRILLSLLDQAYNDFSVIDRIGPIHKATVNFIKWYNETKQQEK